jgi:hypothetical protein
MRKLALVLALMFVVTLTIQPGVAAASTVCTHYCPGGGSISCYAWYTCDSGYDWLQCDNNAPISCPTTCYASCWRDPSISCEGSGDSCSADFDSITCNGVTYPCPTCPDPRQIQCDPAS